MIHVASCAAVGWLAWLAPASQVTGAAASPPNQSGPPASAPAGEWPISIKQTAPVRIAFVEHVGPYWSVGPVIARVREAAAELDEPGPLFIQYLDYRPPASASLRMRVGVILQGMREPQPPLQSDRRPGGTVAYLLASGPHGTTARHHASLLRWAEENGYRVAGPMTEIYWPARSTDARDVVEIQLEVRVAEQVVPQREAETTPPPVPAQPERVPADAPSVPAAAEAPADDSGHPVHMVAFTSGGAGAKNPPAAPVSAADLFQSQRLDAIVDRLLAPWDALSAETQQWLGQFVRRLSALGRGVQSRHPSAANGAICQLIESIRARYDEVAPTAGAELAGSAVHRGVAGDAKATILLELDRLLVRLAGGSTSFDDASVAVLGLVDEAVHIVAEEVGDAHMGPITTQFTGATER